MGTSGRRSRVETVLSIDLGTSRVKTILCAADGSLVARAEGSYPIAAGSGGVAEQDPADWIRSIADCTNRIAEAHEELWPPVACSVTGQMHGLVLVGCDGSVLRHAIICSDSRADAELRQIESALGRETILSTTGNPGLAVFTGPKLLWVKNHEPEVHRKIRRALTPKDYVGYAMTGQAVTDPSDASGTMLYNYRTGSWDKCLCAESGADGGVMPEIRESAEIRGRVTSEFAGLSGIPQGTPVVVGGGDLATTALGLGVEDQDFGFSLGTAGIVFKRVRDVDQEKLGKQFYFRDVMPDYFLGMGSCPSAGLSVRWFREAVSGATDWGSPCPALSRNKSDDGTPLMYIPFLVGTGTPYMNYRARAGFIGLGPEHTVEDMENAIFDGVCFSLRQSYELLRAGSMSSGQPIVCGGGSSNPRWMKIMASVLARPIRVSKQADAAALGAAILAGVAIGWWSAPAEGSAGHSRLCDTVEPDVRLTEMYESLYQRYLTVSSWLNELST